MNVNEISSEAELNECFIKANPDWRNRLRKEARRIHYDYGSDILQLKFGNPGFIFLHWLDTDDEEFQWVTEDEGLHIMGVEIMPFRKGFAPRYPKLQAAYDALCRESGVGDWFIDLPPQSQANGKRAAAVFADLLLESARDLVPA
jgi:hypothetical protein